MGVLYNNTQHHCRYTKHPIEKVVALLNTVLYLDATLIHADI